MNNCVSDKKEFYFGEDVYILLSFTPECAEVRKRGEENILKILSNNDFFKVLIRKLTTFGIAAMDIK